MTSRAGALARATTVAVALLTPSAAVAQASRPPLTFCVRAENAPVSWTGSPPGFEIEIARELASVLGTEPRFVWLEPEALPESALREGACDVAPGMLVDRGTLADEPRLSGLSLTRPYYRAGYAVVRRRERPPLDGLAALGEERIAVEGESVVGFTVRQLGYGVHMLYDAQAVIRALQRDRVRYGYLWAPMAAWLLRAQDGLRLDPPLRAEDTWDFALAVRSDDGALLERLNRAVGMLQERENFSRILLEYGLLRASAP